MWEYQQSSGILKHNDGQVAVGYSGAPGVGKNNPLEQAVHNIGPIPQGKYAIGPPHDTDKHGPYVLRLTQDPANQMFGRDGFLMHGDSVHAPGTASEGCIIMPRNVREQVWESGDHELMVAA